VKTLRHSRHALSRAGWLLPLLAASLFAAQSNPATTQKASAGQGFDAFKLVRTRNIFDPDRRPPVSQNSFSGAASAGPLAQSDYVALTGTLLTKDKALAFFSGSRSEFSQVLPVHDKIAGATISKITVDGVTLERAGKTVNIAVGWTVPLNGSVSAPAPGAAPAAPAVIAAPATAAATALPPPGGAAPVVAPSPAAKPNDDVARMMRERRQQEMQ
jgi:hypothetical protein